VVLETIAVARYEGNHKTAVRAAELLYGGTMARLYRTTAEDEAEAVAYLRRHHDKEYSAVDCLSFVVMLKHGITEAFSFDDDFSHRFVIRPGPSRK
jgi:predicted nucleic acid-binding protein